MNSRKTWPPKLQESLNVLKDTIVANLENFASADLDHLHFMIECELRERDKNCSANIEINGEKW